MPIPRYVVTIIVVVGIPEIQTINIVAFAKGPKNSTRPYQKFKIKKLSGALSSMNSFKYFQGNSFMFFPAFSDSKVKINSDYLKNTTEKQFETFLSEDFLDKPCQTNSTVGVCLIKLIFFIIKTVRPRGQLKEFLVMKVATFMMMLLKDETDRPTE